MEGILEGCRGAGLGGRGRGCDPSAVSSVDERYRASSSTTTRLVLALAAVLLLAVVGWFCWVMWYHVNPKVTSDLGVNYRVDDNHYSITVDIVPAKGVALASVHCTGAVQAKDMSTVAAISYTPTRAGAQTFVVQTLRPGVNLDWEGCTAPGQTDAR